MKAYAAAADANWRNIMEQAATAQHPCTLPAAGSLERRACAQLYYSLALLTSDKALAVVRNVEEGNGMEAWRRLVADYEPRTGMRMGALLQQLLRFSMGIGEESDLTHELDQFERDVRRYEDQSGETLSDNIKHSIICGNMKNQKLRDHLELNMDRLRDYVTLKQEIVAYGRARRVFHDPNAMQVDPITGKDKGKGKNKDKGKGKSKDKDKGKGKEKAPHRGEATCHYCGKKGHYKKECRTYDRDVKAGKVTGKGTAAAAVTPSTDAAPVAQVSCDTADEEVWFLHPLVFDDLYEPTKEMATVVAHLYGAAGDEFALVDSGSGITTCPA
eukprot:4921657-Amphidinium_carterae.1